MILAFVLAVFVLGYFLYLLFFKAGPAARISEQPLATTTAPGGLPAAGPMSEPTVGDPDQRDGLASAPDGTAPVSEVARGGLTQTGALNQKPSLGAALAADGRDLLYYDKEEGRFYRLGPDGKLSRLTDTVFHQAQKITWSPDRNRAILEYPDEAKIIYDFKNNKQISLPSHWKDFSFSPDGSKIVMKSMALDPANRWLAVISGDGTAAQRVAALGDKDQTVYPSWSPNNQTVAMYTEGVNFDRQTVYFVGLNNENFKSLTIDGRGFDAKWSPQGDRLLYSVYSNSSDLRPELWISAAQGENIGSWRVKLNLQTWAGKCVFASSVDLYCAAPDSLEQGAGLFPELAKNSPDSLYKIDARSGLKKLVAVPDGRFNMTDLLVSADGVYLYFTDANSERIHKIKLK